MTDFGLVSISVTAFLAVFVLLGFLAAVMRILIAVFPAQVKSLEGIEGKIDSGIVAAVITTARAAFPGFRVTKIEVKK